VWQVTSAHSAVSMAALVADVPVWRPGSSITCSADNGHQTVSQQGPTQRSSHVAREDLSL